jgi:hypothetical protein
MRSPGGGGCALAFGMKRSVRIWLVLAAALLLVVCSGWCASENVSGRLGRRLVGVGDLAVWPGRMIDAILSGNLDGGFGGWWSGGIRIVFSWLVWGAPLVVAWLFDRPKNDVT